MQISKRVSVNTRIILGGLSIRAVVVSPCVLSQSSRKPAERDTADRGEGITGAAVDIRLILVWVESGKTGGEVECCRFEKRSYQASLFTNSVDSTCGVRNG